MFFSLPCGAPDKTLAPVCFVDTVQRSDGRCPRDALLHAHIHAELQPKQREPVSEAPHSYQTLSAGCCAVSSPPCGAPAKTLGKVSETVAPRCITVVKSAFIRIFSACGKMNNTGRARWNVASTLPKGVKKRWILPAESELNGSYSKGLDC